MTSLCKKCLLSELSKEEYFKNIYAYIESLPSEQKVDDKEYQHRLSLCKGCEHLINGMCKICGCFVEVRAAKKISHCPSLECFW